MLISRGMRANATYCSSIGAADHSRLREKQLHPLLDAAGFIPFVMVRLVLCSQPVQLRLWYSGNYGTLTPESRWEFTATSLAMSSAVLCKVVRQGWCTRAGRPRFVRKLGFVRKFGCKLLKTKLVW